MIVVTYNGEAWVDYCFSSILSSTISADIICIDNNSSDNTVPTIEENYPTVELIKSNENLGFGRGNNIGLKRSLNKGYDYSFLLNQDARVEPDAIEKLIYTHKNNNRYGILSPIHRSIENDRLDFNFSNYLSANATKNFISDSILGLELQDVYDTKFVNAALWLISRDCLEQTGFFDPIFPHYGEDDDFVSRAIDGGFKIGIVPKALGNHARYKIKASRNDKNYGSDFNRKYVNLLINYKRNRATPVKKIFYFFRKMISELFFHGLMFDFHLFKRTLVIYLRMFYNLSHPPR